jgi:hypothetical protein
MRQQRTRVLRERVMLARGLDRASGGPAGRGVIRAMYPIIRPSVAAACRASLTRTAAALRDPSVDVSADAIVAVRALLGDGVSSPLFGESVDVALATVTAHEQRVAA